MIGKPEDNRCYFCGGKLVPRVTMLPFVIQDHVVIIKNIPAEVCTQCGEAVLDSPTARRVDQLVRQARQSGFEVSILAYPAVPVTAD